MTTFKNLQAWKKSMELVEEVYRLTQCYPKDEQFGLTSQTRRAAVSVPTNIAEGIGRNYKKDSIQFLHISRGSLYELETLLQIGLRLKITQQDRFEVTSLRIEECIKILNGLISYFERGNLK